MPLLNCCWGNSTLSSYPMKGGTDVRNERRSTLVSSAEAEAEASSVPYADGLVAGVVNIDGEPCGPEKPDEALDRVEAVDEGGRAIFHASTALLRCPE